MQTLLRSSSPLAALAVLALLSPRAPAASGESGPLEIFWAPTLEQGLEMARATGRPLFLMGYSLVPSGTTYTKLGDDHCTGVF